MSASLRSEYQDYRCWLFDCDGVLMDSNAVKTQAFYDVALPYGEDVAEKLMAYHVEHGGVSRFVKVEELFTGILKRPPKDGEVAQVLDDFAAISKARMLACPTAPRIEEVLEAVSKTGPVFVVSGSMQDELREVFAARGLDKYFTAIFGSPDDKDTIVERELRSGAMAGPALFVGDARYDFEVAERYGLDFAFATAWTDFAGWETYFEDKPATLINSIADLLF